MEKQSLLQFPLLTKEWDYDSNSTRPEDHMSEDHKKVYWKCSKCGYHWKAAINERAYHGSGCPKCSFNFKLSSPEQAVFYYVKQVFPDTVNLYKPDFLTGMQVAVYVPSLHLGIEYDGKNWQKYAKRDSRKSELLKRQSVSLIRIKEMDMSNPYDDYAVIKTEYNDKLVELLPAIEDLFRQISVLCGSTVTVVIDLERDGPAIYALSEGISYSKSLQASGSDVLTEWAYDLNKAFTPDKITPGSWRSVWWRCSVCGKEYQQSIRKKIKDGLGCESCSMTRVNEKRTDTATGSDEKTVAEDQYLLSEWNDEIDPATILQNSKYKARWKCSKCSYIFTMAVKNRTGQKQGCPICRHRNNVAKRGYSVINVSTGKVYHSVNEACRDTNVPISSIRSCCLGQISHAGGYKWAYANEKTKTE